MSKAHHSPPLLILGFDAGDAEYIRRWAQEGYLPAIASIMERGHIGGPDLMRFIYRVFHPKGELVQMAPWYNRSSYHSFQGFFATSGPSIASGAFLGEVPLLDLAPTFFSLLGERSLNLFAGRLINRMISAEVPHHG